MKSVRQTAVTGEEWYLIKIDLFLIIKIANYNRFVFNY